MPDLMQKQPGDSHSKWSKDGARLTATQDSTFDWRELRAQVSRPSLHWDSRGRSAGTVGASRELQPAMRLLPVGRDEMRRRSANEELGGLKLKGVPLTSL
jgi:hypothetical protein